MRITTSFPSRSNLESFDPRRERGRINRDQGSETRYDLRETLTITVGYHVTKWSIRAGTYQRGDKQAKEANKEKRSERRNGRKRERKKGTIVTARNGWRIQDSVIEVLVHPAELPSFPVQFSLFFDTRARALFGRTWNSRVIQPAETL